jgi:hypothetical protein
VLDVRLKTQAEDAAQWAHVTRVALVALFP